MSNKNYYKLDKELENSGWRYNETGVYVPYLFKNDDNPDPREVYLKISRLPSEDTHFEYTWVKLHNGNYYNIAHSAIGSNPVNQEVGRFIFPIMSAGTHATLDSTQGSYKNFYMDLKDKITESNLDILKEENYEFNYTQKSELKEKQAILNDLNTQDVREIASKVIDNNNLVKHYNNPYKPYDHYICPWHDDKEPSAMAYEQLFYCTSTNCSVGKMDQEALIRHAFNLETTDEVIDKYIELFYQ